MYPLTFWKKRSSHPTYQCHLVFCKLLLVAYISFWFYYLWGFVLYILYYKYVHFQKWRPYYSGILKMRTNQCLIEGGGGISLSMNEKERLINLAFCLPYWHSLICGYQILNEWRTSSGWSWYKIVICWYIHYVYNFEKAWWTGSLHVSFQGLPFWVI